MKPDDKARGFGSVLGFQARLTSGQDFDASDPCVQIRQQPSRANPAELAYAETDIDLEITRLGDVITIFPARDSLKEAVAALRHMPKPPRVEKRQPIDVPVRRRD